jgi:hypothetical protein
MMSQTQQEVLTEIVQLAEGYTKHIGLVYYEGETDEVILLEVTRLRALIHLNRTVDSDGMQLVGVL